MSKSKKQFECEYCDSILSTASNLKIHINTNKKCLRIQKSQNVDYEPEEKKEKQKFVCVCNYNTLIKHHYNIHILVCTEYKISKIKEEHQTELKIKEDKYNNELKIIKDKYTAKIGELKIKEDKLEEKYENEIDKYKIKIGELYRQNELIEDNFKETISKLEVKLEKFENQLLSNSSTPTIHNYSTNTTTNHNTIILKNSDFSNENILSKLELYTPQNYLDGLYGASQWLIKSFFEKKILEYIEISDKNRKHIKLKVNDNIVEDKIGGKILTDKIFPILKPRLIFLHNQRNAFLEKELEEEKIRKAEKDYLTDRNTKVMMELMMMPNNKGLLNELIAEINKSQLEKELNKGRLLMA